jgi:hypothetical protein
MAWCVTWQCHIVYALWTSTQPSTFIMQIHYEWICVVLSTDVCMYVCLYVFLYVTKCIVTKLLMLQTSPLTQIYIPLDNRNRSTKRHRKIPPIWPPGAILNLWRPKFENAITFEPCLRIRATPFCSGLNYLEFRLHLCLANQHFPSHKMLSPKHNKCDNFRTVRSIYIKPASFCSRLDCH